MEYEKYDEYEEYDEETEDVLDEDEELKNYPAAHSHHKTFKFGHPTDEELDKYDSILTDIAELHMARRRMSEEEHLAAEKELESIRKTHTGLHMLLCYRVSEISHAFGYPVIAMDTLGSSIIAYYLNITDENPFTSPYYLQNFRHFWGDGAQKTIRFNISIAPCLYAPIDHSLYISTKGIRLPHCTSEEEIKLHCVPELEFLGKMEKASGKSISKAMNDADMYPLTLKAMSSLASENMLCPAGFCQGEDYFKESLSGADACDFQTLTDYTAYYMAYSAQPKTLDKLKKYGGLVYTDDRLAALLKYGVPLSDAGYIIDVDIFIGEDKTLLAEHSVPEELIDILKSVYITRTRIECAKRAKLLNAVTWYKVKYPEESEKVMSGIQSADD